MNSSTKKLFVVIISSIILIDISIIYFTETNLSNQIQKSIESRENQATLLASKLEQRLGEAINVLEITGRQDIVRNVEYSNLIDEKIKGIPQDADIEKRTLAKEILAQYKDFEFISFNMPNGDFYMLEPYQDQLNLQQLNFAHRDWYKGVMSTHDTYVSEVYVSGTLQHNIVAVRLPVYADNGSMTGIWGGSINLQVLTDELRQLDLGNNERIIFVDHKGVIISDSALQSTAKELQSLADLDIVQKVLTGNSGHVIETLNDATTLFVYHPVQSKPNKWGVFITQPYDDAFPFANVIRTESYLMIALSTSIISLAGYLLQRTIRTNLIVTEKLREIDRAKEEFSSMMTHELKTPLVPILGFTEMLLNQRLGDLTPKQREKIQVIYQNALSLSRLISDLLDVHKLEIGKIRFDMVDTPVKEIVDQSIDSLRSLSEEKNVVITYNIEEPDIIAKCDAKRIKQVLYNLITNAVKFVPEHSGRIEISVKRQNGSVLFAVKDNGIGIPKTKQQNLFKRFYQIDSSLSRNSGGTGLGLAISKGIVESHNGRIWLTSEVDQGSTFFFTIPMSTIGAKN